MSEGIPFIYMRGDSEEKIAERKAATEKAVAKQKRDAEAFAAAQTERISNMLVGETIEAVRVDTHTDRIQGLVITLSDGREIHIDYFAVYADDAGLDVEERP